METADIKKLTREQYRFALNQFYDWLPKGKELHTGILEEWREELMKRGYAQRTAFSQISACNSFVTFLGRQDLRIIPGELEINDQPEISREEYLRLLVAARSMDDELDYLMIKLIAGTGIPMHKLEKLTLEEFQQMQMPDMLRKEILDYAKRNGILSGYLFRTSNGTAYNRRTIYVRMQKLCGIAHVSEDRATPRCLQKLYRQTMDEIRGDIDLMANISFNRMLEREQAVVAWSRG